MHEVLGGWPKVTFCLVSIAYMGPECIQLGHDGESRSLLLIWWQLLRICAMVSLEMCPQHGDLPRPTLHPQVLSKKSSIMDSSFASSKLPSTCILSWGRSCLPPSFLVCKRCASGDRTVAKELANSSASFIVTLSEPVSGERKAVADVSVSSSFPQESSLSLGPEYSSSVASNSSSDFANVCSNVNGR